MPDTLLAFGSAVKALGEGKIGGHLVLYGSPETPDLSNHRDYFVATTEYDIEPGERRGVYWNHGQDPKIGVKKIGAVTVTPDEHGLWVEGVLDMADEYQRSIHDLVVAGKIGWSSGAPAHLVARKAIETKSGTVHEITHWPVAEASLTATPADYRNVSHSIKSLRATLQDESRTDTTALKAMLRGSMAFSDHADIAQDAIAGFVDRATGLLELTTKAGREISAANREKIKGLHAGMQLAHAAMGTHIATMQALLNETEPAAKKTTEVEQIYIRMLAREAAALGVEITA